MVPGLYIRRVVEPSLTDSDDNVLLCAYLRLYNDNSIEVNEVTYLNGDNCVNSTAEVVWTHQFTSTLTTSSSVSICCFSFVLFMHFVQVQRVVPVADDYRSDILGAYQYPPNEDTFRK